MFILKTPGREPERASLFIYKLPSIIIPFMTSKCRNVQAVINPLHFRTMTAMITRIYADRLKADPERRHKVKGRNSFAFSDVRRIIAEAALGEDFDRVCPKPATPSKILWQRYCFAWWPNKFLRNFSRESYFQIINAICGTYIIYIKQHVILLPTIKLGPNRLQSMANLGYNPLIAIQLALAGNKALAGASSCIFLIIELTLPRLP